MQGPLERSESTSAGRLSTLTDAEGGRTTYEYDAFDRLLKLRFPHPTSDNVSSTTDYEQLGYDAASNVISVRRRDGNSIVYAYDALNRLSTLNPPGTASDVSYAYDNFSRLLTAVGGQTLTNVYDALSRLTSADHSVLGIVAYQYDEASRRTRITWPDMFCAQYAYDLAGAVTQIRAEGGACTATTLASYGYDNLGRRVSVTRGNATSEAITFDSAGRLDKLTQNLAGTGNDLTLSFDFNAAGQITSRSGSDADFAWTPLAPGTTSYTDNNLSQYTNVGGAAQAHDTRGNLTTGSFGYDILNRLTSGPSSATFSYDPASRLYQTVGGGVTTRFLYDGAQAIAEYNASNVLQRRFIPGPSLDEPIVWYEGSGTTDRRWLVADERGSIIAITNSSGAASTINRYDEYGVPAATNAGRFQYTGQMWLPEAARYHYRARVYAPTTGRFQQSDPILYAAGMNLYAYVGNEPLNFTDPFGLQEEMPPIVVVGIDPCNNTRGCDPMPNGPVGMDLRGGFLGGSTYVDDVGTRVAEDPNNGIVVTGIRRQRPRRGLSGWTGFGSGEPDTGGIYQCVLAEYEFSVGVQAFGNLKPVLVGVGGLADAGSVRFRIGFNTGTGFHAYRMFTRGWERTLSIGPYDGTDYSVSERNDATGAWGPAEEGTSHFAGASLGGGLLLGHNFRLGATSDICPAGAGDAR